jgi:GNAT superfamily N-acetyltransferase
LQIDEPPRLRRACAPDAPAITALTRAAYAKWIPVIGREPLPMTIDYARAIEVHRFDLMEIESRLVALIETVRQGEWLMIENVAVDPANQGRGWGRRLIGLAEQIARDMNLAGARLYTNKLFAQNLRLYAALGYRVDREELLSDGGVAVHMVKRAVDIAGS